MAILTGPDYSLPPFQLAEDKALPREQQTDWYLRQPGTECSIAIKQMLMALYGGRPIDPKRLDDAVRAVLNGADNLRAGGELIAWEEEPCKRALLGEKRDTVVSESILRRLPLSWKMELLAYVIAPQLNSDDVGN